MRILTVGNMFPPHRLGGYELVWRSAVAHLRRAGHEVRVLTSDYRAPAPDGDEEADVHRELRWYWQAHDFPRLGALSRLRLERHNRRVLARHLGDFAPEVVSWWSMGGMSLSLIESVRRRGRASNAVVCDDWMLYAPEVDQWTRALRRRPRLRRLAEAVVGVPGSVDLRGVGPALFPSETLRRRATAALGLENTYVCPLGVDTDLFRPAPEKPWSWRLAYVGRIDRRKGVELAVRALAELPPEATLTIDGGGDQSYRAELEATTRRLGVEERVSFTARPRRELPSLYAAADAVVFPVLWEEPWGLVPLEAMASGRPVIATGRGGSAEYLCDAKNCLVFDPAQGAPALARAVRRLATDTELRAELRQGGLRTSARFSEEEWNEAVERLCARWLRPVAGDGAVAPHGGSGSRG